MLSWKTYRSQMKKRVAGALGVAITLNAGAALVYSARVLDAYEAMSTAG